MDMVTAVREQFRPARRPGRIGVEVELIPVTDGPRPQPVDPAVLMTGFDSGFIRAAAPTFEPGGQLELSPPPRPGVDAMVRDLVRLVDRADALAAARGVRLESVGTNPHHSCAQVPLRTPTPRYRAMEKAFDRKGPDGRVMMRLTASLQVCVDLLPGRAGREQWLVANLAGPPLAAAFANSTVVDGRPSGLAGARTRIWQGVDLLRTGYDGRYLDPADPVGAYAAFSAAAPRLPIPAAADPLYHLTTLFPPVRPRGGYLEVRYLDAQPRERMAEAVATVATLLCDPRARGEALELLLPRADRMWHSWHEAAHGTSPESAELLSIVGDAHRACDRLAGAGRS